MRKSLTHLVVIVTLLAALLGQAMAFSASSPCDSSSIELTHVEGIDDESLQSSASPDNDCCDTSCCDSDCVCTAGACSPALYCTDNLSPDYFTAMVSAKYLTTSAEPNSITSLRYRPPISS